MTSVVRLNPRADFVHTAYVQSLTQRGLSYLSAGFPLHLSGPTGVGKTTMAMHIAHQVGRPVMLMAGDDEFGASDLVGGATGYDRKHVVDRFIHSVKKVEDSVREAWVDNRLTLACREGFTLVYDEFTRSRPEANNVLLSVLEEGVLILPARRRGSGYLRVHPDFKAIFTSNPEEYAGVHKAQDALLERMVTLQVGLFDLETEVAITESRSGVSTPDAAVIVSIVREARSSLGDLNTPTVRSAVVLGRVLAQEGRTVDDPWFSTTVTDVLVTALVKPARKRGQSMDEVRDALAEIVATQVALRPEWVAASAEAAPSVDESAPAEADVTDSEPAKSAALSGV
ncbi:MAG: gas vesicle protein GvpN [Candidatus Nanopelagicales bacterium]